ncbi:WxL protein peptidoglycan domain-containing protein [uncultured Vagococcus sp.]|uniref:DUF916 domain-containing protein n=1 Tax=uncultured Vagococcus sp. TaxID=189676 RepID=UPI0028D189C2|nr:DUF916 domain-containing protein [uncultured Vagococcus sp.]
MRKLTTNQALVMPFLLLLLCLLMPVVSQAESDKPEEGIGFSYRNMMPENQIGEGNYFDLLVKPSQKQTVITEVTNETDDELKLNVHVSDAKTGETGIIEYSPSSLKNTNGLKVKLTDIAQAPKEVRLKKGETKQIEIDLTIPKKEFEGVILGGIELQKVSKEEKTKDKVMIRNEYTYVYSVSLRESLESESSIKGSMSPNNSIFVTKGGKNMAKASFNNDTPTIVREMVVESYVTASDSDRVLAESKLEQMRMAPYSQIDFPIMMDKPKVGSYMTHTKVTVGQLSWEWQEPFEVTENNLKESKTYAEAIIKNEVSIGLLLTIIVVLIMGTFILYMVIRRLIN